eukprot:scaffold318490_cov32-Tisochrysis_lutea.AAC.3
MPECTRPTIAQHSSHHAATPPSAQPTGTPTQATHRPSRGTHPRIQDTPSKHAGWAIARRRRCRHPIQNEPTPWPPSAPTSSLPIVAVPARSSCACCGAAPAAT